MPSRAFVALPLPPATRRALVAVREAFVAEAPAWRDEKWVVDENLHVTLKFIGALPDEAIDDVVVALAAACASVPVFRLRLDAVRAVGGHRARMLWASSSERCERCAELARAIDAALLPFDVPAEERPFKTHVTLVRARHPRPVPRQALEAASSAIGDEAHERHTIVSVSAAKLFASRLGRTGPTYTELARLPLGSD